jgi:Xaa-Pro aminopeptidase
MGMVKNKREIELLKKSAQISNSCLPLIENLLNREKITEKEVARAIRRKIYSQGARLAFRTIVACGRRSAKIHPKPHATNRIISGLGYVDFGASYKGYKTDVTVPFIKGNISKKEEKIVRSVLKAYDLAIRSIKIGLPCWKLHEKVDDFLKKKGFRLGHSLGHGLGRKIHELPTIGMPRKKFDKKKKLKWEKVKKIRFQRGMVFTIEPGVYLKGMGGCRLENDLLLARKGSRILTHGRLIERNKALKP